MLNDQQRLQEYYRLLLDIQPKRALLEHNHRATPAQQMAMPDSHLQRKTLPQQLMEWSPEGTRQYDLYWPRNVRLNGPWGEELLCTVIQWWNQLQWPTCNNCTIQTSGITWGELLLDFLLDRRMNTLRSQTKWSGVLSHHQELLLDDGLVEQTNEWGAAQTSDCW